MKELVIPLRIDDSQAKASLGSIGIAGQEVGEKIQTGSDKAKQSLLDAVQAGLGFVGVVSAAQEFKQMAHAIGEEFKATADYIAQTSKEFIEFQKHLRESASLTGRMPTKEYTMQQLDLASKGRILSAEEYRSGLDAFNRFGSQFVSDEGQKATAMVDQGAINQILPEIMGVAKAKNIDQATAGKALAAIVAKMPKGTTPEQYKQEFMKLMGPAEFTSGSAQVTWEQLATIAMPYVGRGTIFGPGAEGLEKAEEFMGVIQQARPMEAATYTRDALKMIKDMRQKGELEGMGVTEEEMKDPNKIVEAIGRAWRKSGQNWEDFITPHMHGRVAIQGQEALQASILARETEGGSLGRKIREKMAEGEKVKPAEYLQSYIQSGAAGDVMESEAEIDISRKKGGAVDSDAIAAMKRTEAEMERAGEFRGFSLERTLSSFTRQLRFLDASKDTRERQIQMHTLQRLSEQAEQAGIPHWQINQEMQNFWGSGRSMEQEFTRLIEMTREANSLHQKQVNIAESRGRPALSAPPPDHQARQ